MRGLKPLIGVFLLFVAFGNAWATTDEEIFRDFRFNFINPGARSAGLGGAFIAAADDATAIGANPAALHYVSRYEVFLEYRSVMPQTVTQGPSNGPFGSKDVDSMEDFTDFNLVTNREDTQFVSYAAFVLPVRLGKKRATFAFSRHVVLNGEISLTDGANQTMFDVSLLGYPIVTVPGDFPDPPTTERYSVNSTVMGQLDAQLVHYNFGFSISLLRDFSLGLTGTYAELSMDSLLLSNTLDPYPVLTSVHPRLGPPGAVSDITRQTIIDDQTDNGFGYTVGLHWHPDSVFPSGVSPVRFGLVYRKGADLGVDETVNEFNAVSGMFEQIDGFVNVLKVPDRWGFGASYHGNHWLFSADLERVRYSDLLDGFVTGVNFFTSLPAPDAVLTFDVDDGTIFRVGGEYAFVNRAQWEFSFRAGYFNQPDNKIALKSVTNVTPQQEAIFLDLFRGGEDIDHFTAGFSIGTPVGLQLQFAGDFSDAGDQLVVSGIYQFGKTVLGR